MSGDTLTREKTDESFIGLAEDLSLNAKALSHKTRNKAFFILMNHEKDGTQMRVKDLAALMGVSEYKLPHHLKIMREAGLVFYRRRDEDKRTHYYLLTEKGKQLLRMLAVFNAKMAGVREQNDSETGTRTFILEERDRVEELE